MSMRAFKGASFSRLSKRGGGEGEKIAEAGNKSEKSAGTREHKSIFEGNKGTRNPLGDPPLNKVLYGEASPRGPSPYPFIHHF